MMEQTDQAMTQVAPATAPLAQLATAAGTLIERALPESLGPVQTLGTALVRLTASAPAGALQTRADLTLCIQSLQFHDRLAPRLIQVRNLRAPLSLAAPSPSDRPGTAAPWERLRALLTVERGAPGPSAPPEDYGSLRMRAEDGSVELF